MRIVHIILILSIVPNAIALLDRTLPNAWRGGVESTFETLTLWLSYIRPFRWYRIFSNKLTISIIAFFAAVIPAIVFNSTFGDQAYLIWKKYSWTHKLVLAVLIFNFIAYVRFHQTALASVSMATPLNDTKFLSLFAFILKPFRYAARLLVATIALTISIILILLAIHWFKFGSLPQITAEFVFIAGTPSIPILVVFVTLFFVGIILLLAQLCFTVLSLILFITKEVFFFVFDHYNRAFAIFFAAVSIVTALLSCHLAKQGVN